MDCEAIDSIEYFNTLVVADGEGFDVRVAASWKCEPKRLLGVIIGRNSDGSHTLQSFVANKCGSGGVGGVFVYDGLGEPGLSWDKCCGDDSQREAAQVMEMTEEEIETIADAHESLVMTVSDQEEELLDDAWVVEGEQCSGFVVNSGRRQDMSLIGNERGKSIYMYSSNLNEKDELDIQSVLGKIDLVMEALPF